MRGLRPIAAWGGIAILAMSCGAKSDKMTLEAGGSTFIYPIMSKWSGEYAKIKGVVVRYDSLGSSRGVTGMTGRVFDFGCTDGPMDDEELKQARDFGGEVVHIPLVMGAVAPVYNLEEVKEPLRFTGPVLAEIFLGKIVKWNDRVLQTLNPKVTLPDKAIHVVHRSDGSGTTYIWVDYLAKVSPEWSTRVGVGKSVKWPCGEGKDGNKGVAGEISNTPGSIGYVELTYTAHETLQHGLVENRDGVFVDPSPAGVIAAAKNSVANIPDDLRYSISDAAGRASYPISGTAWAIVYVNQPSEKSKTIADFLRWVLHDGQQFAEELHYAPLPPELVERAERKIDQMNDGH
jgi:phosphate ABC transporter phosphate-binding protein